MNFIIIGLLIPTIIYTYKLNRSLRELRQNQSSLAKLISSLNEATFKAENSIPKLKTLTKDSSEGLKDVVESAKTLKDDLMFINERANNLADRLEGVIHDGRNIKTEKNEAAPMQPKEKNVDEERSLAEMELLKALRSIK